MYGWWMAVYPFYPWIYVIKAIGMWVSFIPKFNNVFVDDTVVMTIIMTWYTIINTCILSAYFAIACEVVETEIDTWEEIIPEQSPDKNVDFFFDFYLIWEFEDFRRYFYAPDDIFYAEVWDPETSNKATLFVVVLLLTYLLVFSIVPYKRVITTVIVSILSIKWFLVTSFFAYVWSSSDILTRLDLNVDDIDIDNVNGKDEDTDTNLKEIGDKGQTEKREPGVIYL